MTLEFEPCQIPEMPHFVAVELVIMHVLEFGFRHVDPVPAPHAATGFLVPILITRPKPIGAPGVYVNLSLRLVAEVPAGEVTVMSMVPVPIGAVAEMEASEFTVNIVAAVDPNLTDVAPVNPLPKRLTTVPPESGPEFGEIPETVIP